MKQWQIEGSIIHHTKFARVLIYLTGICIMGYILGPPLYWHLIEGLSAASSSSSFSCLPCICDCSSQPLLALPEGLSNGSFTDCMRRDPDVSEEMEKNFTDMLLEEVRTKGASVEEKWKRADVRLLEAKKMASQYQKEADKCSSGMETCEGARERAESILEEQKKMTIMWQLRARYRGWKERSARLRTQ